MIINYEVMKTLFCPLISAPFSIRNLITSIRSLSQAIISGVAANSSCDKRDNSEDVNNTEYAGDSVNNTQKIN